MAPARIENLEDRIAGLEEDNERLRQRVERERERLEQAERIAERSTRELYERQRELEELAATLEQRVADRTAEVENRLAQQTALQEVSRFALQRVEIDDLVAELCRRTAEVLDTHYCDAFALRPQHDDLVLRAGVGWPEGSIDEMTIDAGEGSQSGHTIENWEPTIVHDQAEEDRFDQPPAFAEAGIRSSVTVVVPAPEDPWGVFGVHAREPRAFDEHDVRFVQAMSRVLSQAIHRQRAQRDVEQEKQRFESIVQQVEEYAIFNCDPDGNIRTWNKGAERITGYTEAEILEESFRVLYTEEDREEGVPESNLQRAAELGSFEDEGWRVREDGSRFWASVAITALRDAEGNLRGFSKVTRDMTDRMEYEQRLEASNKRLEQFAYAASHDLQEPLRMVTSYLQLFEDRYGDELDEEGLEYVGQALDGAQRMRGMIESLLTYARVRTEGREPEPVDANAVLDDAMRDLELRIEEANAEVRVDELPIVRADPDQLAQVFRNLLSNAFRYSGDQAPRVHVHSTRLDGRWRISVEDEGVGIPPERSEEVFEVFRSFDEDEGGTGIGLAICRQIVDRHGGEIWVDSRPGEGSSFHFTMPAPEAEGEGALQASSS